MAKNRHKDNLVTNIQHCPLPLGGNNERAPNLIIGVVGSLLPNDLQVTNPDGPNASATAVESTDDQMNRGRTEYRAPTRLNQAVKGAADQYLTAARPSY